MLFSWLTISCKQKCCETLRMHQIRFCWGCFGSDWKSSRHSPRPLVGWGEEYHLLISLPLWCASFLAPRLELWETCSKDLGGQMPLCDCCAVSVALCQVGVWRATHSTVWPDSEAAPLQADASTDTLWSTEASVLSVTNWLACTFAFWMLMKWDSTYCFSAALCDSAYYCCIVNTGNLGNVVDHFVSCNIRQYIRRCDESFARVPFLRFIGHVGPQSPKLGINKSLMFLLHCVTLILPIQLNGRSRLQDGPSWLQC